jgi:hypothetical protein
MAKKTAEPKPPVVKSEENFVELMLLAADFVKSSGGMEQAKRSLEAAGEFIDRAGSVTGAAKALTVLESLKDRISG